MKVQKQKSAAKSTGLGPVLILAVVLGILFWRSFLPEFVAFSNDGPLGQQNAAAARLPAAFWGTWYDNNDIGGGGGDWAVSISALFRWLVGPVGYAKFLVPFALFVLGLGAWCFFRQLKLSPLAATLGALAAALNSAFFAIACWGVAPQEIAIGMDFFALALVVSLTAETPLTVRLARLAMAGLCVGMNVMEAADIGAIFSVFVAAFVVANALSQTQGSLLSKFLRGVGQVALVAAFAGFIALQAVVSLVGAEIQGVVGTGQDAQTKSSQWPEATMWSLPKTETLELFVPGLFGYKLDTPQNMAPEFAAQYAGGNYWGGMGRDPALDPYFAGGRQGTPPPAQWRQTSGTDYAGVLVVLVALWAAAQALRKQPSLFSETQRRLVWFWSGVVVMSILFAWGRFSVFYALLYQLPYFSAIRSPTKFLIVFSWAIVVLFAYGIDTFSRTRLATANGKPVSPRVQFKIWWTTTARFDRRWFWGCLAAVGFSLVGWLIYAAEKPDLIHYLHTTGFPDGGPALPAAVIAAFSINQAGWFVGLLAVAVVLCLLVVSGVLGGPRARFGGLLLGLFLLGDLGRADLPYIIHWDYHFKYDITAANPADSTNPILNFLRDKSYEHRVAQLPFPAQVGGYPFDALYQYEWMQHQFPYYNIQSLDNWQRPRVGTDSDTYERAVYCNGRPETISRLPRQWQLTNTRYLLGAADFLEGLNTQLDPEHRFRIVERFSVEPKPGITQVTQYTDITAVPNTNGPYALFEFTGALPRVKLYSTWQVQTNYEATLQTLGRPDFDPVRTVLVDAPPPGLALAATNANNGTVDFKSYAPARIVLAASTPTPAVLLLNDKFDPNWKVTVDGQSAPVLRCNFIMRGVFLNPGAHTVEFTYTLPARPLYITLSAYAVAILLAGFLVVTRQRKEGIGI